MCCATRFPVTSKVTGRFTLLLFLDLKSHWACPLFCWFSFMSSWFLIHLIFLIATCVFCLENYCINNFRLMMVNLLQVRIFFLLCLTSFSPDCLKFTLYFIPTFLFMSVVVWPKLPNSPLPKFRGWQSNRDQCSQILRHTQFTWYLVKWWHCQQEWRFWFSRSKVRTRSLHFNKLPDDGNVNIWIKKKRYMCKAG